MPKLVGNYILDYKIESGLYGDIYKGHNKQNSCDHTIQAIKRENIKGQILELLQNEIAVMKSCKNKNIIKLYDIKKTTNHFYLIFQYCNEGNLKQYLDKNTILTEKRAVQFLGQILNAFKTLFDKKIIHRDLKLSNILLHNGQVKITDFGFIKLLNQEELSDMTQYSPLSIAPEILEGMQFNNHNSKSDIWSIGVVLYQMLFGNQFKAQSAIQMMKNIKMTKHFQFPKQINNISNTCEDVLRKMLTFNPQKRIQWSQLFNHQIVTYWDKQIKKQLSATIKQSQNITLSASKFYLKTNMVVDHPKQIAKNENINGFTFETLNRGKQASIESFLSKDNKSNELILTETTAASYNRSEQTLTEIDQIGDQQTWREKQIKAFKRNAQYILHRRNVYVFLASVAQEVLDFGKNMKESEVVAYLLIRKLLQLLASLQQLIDSKQLIELQLWQPFQKQKDFQDIKNYVWKQQGIFKVFLSTIENNIKIKINSLHEDTQIMINNHKEAINDKFYQQQLKKYFNIIFSDINKKFPQSQLDERKYYVHLLKIIDCLQIEDVFQFQKNGVIFNFHNYYEEPLRLDLQKLRSEVINKNSII